MMLAPTMPHCFGMLDRLEPMKPCTLTLILTALATIGCAPHYRAAPPAALIHLTKAVHAEIAYADSTAPDDELLQEIYTKNPELRRDLGPFKIQTLRSGTRSVTLVCSADGKRGLLEDASWTPRLDRQWQKTDKKHSCAFDPTLDPKIQPQPVAR